MRTHALATKRQLHVEFPSVTTCKIFREEKWKFTSRCIMEKDETDKEILLREEEDISAGKQGNIISLLTAMNENMKAMDESLKRFHEGPNLGNAEAAKSQRSP